MSYQFGDKVRITNCAIGPEYTGCTGTVNGVILKDDFYWISLDDDPTPRGGRFPVYGDELEPFDG